jgi:predicted AlkP superfamily pyrophosphatase or phosphodiesterase
LLLFVLLPWLVSIPAQAEPTIRESPGSAPTTVILISLDGTRPVDVTNETLPSLVALADAGASAVGLIPATPSNTFPGHVTLVTGVSPDRHGIVNNFFIDPERGRFQKRDTIRWIEVEPLWSLLAGHGLVSASFHWVGSEGPWRSGRGPRHWRAFSSSTPVAEKVDTILSWLDLEDPALRPQLITSWFHGTDHAAHRDGPGSPSALAQLARQEPALGKLVAGIAARKLWATTTLIIVSDHGMATADRLLDFDAILDEAGVKAWVTGMGGFATVYLDRDQSSEPQLAARIESIARSVGLEAIRRVERNMGDEKAEENEKNGRSRFTHPRFGDWIIRAPIGTAIHRPGLPAGGFHGYASENPAMHGLFIAAGRGVTPGARLPLLHSIDIAPTVLSLLGVEIPEWMRGSPIEFDPPKVRE